MLAIVMFLALIALYVVMVGFVKFSENVIGTPQLARSGDGAGTKAIDSTEAL